MGLMLGEARWPLLTVRQRRRERRDRLSAFGVTPTRARRAWCVTITAIEMPPWAIKKCIPGLSASLTRIWLKPRDARFLMHMDRAAGGQPWYAESEFRRCGVCHRPLLGEDAAARRQMDESTMTGRQLPCGSECIEASKDKRWG